MIHTPITDSLVPTGFPRCIQEAFQGWGPPLASSHLATLLQGDNEHQPAAKVNEGFQQPQAFLATRGTDQGTCTHKYTHLIPCV